MQARKVILHTWMKEAKDQCDFCEMNHHVASVHGGKKPFKCNICDANFSENGNMTWSKEILNYYTFKTAFNKY